MTSSPLTPEQRQAITSVLNRTSTYVCTRRLLAIVTRAVSMNAPLPAVRKWLINTLPSNDSMMELLEREDTWNAAVARATEFVALRRSDNSSDRVMEAAVRQMVAIALTPAFSSVARGGYAAGRNGFVVQETDARALSVVVAKRIVENIADRGIDTALISLELLRAQLGVTPRTARCAIEWGVENRFLLKKMRSKSGAYTYGLRALRPQQLDALREKQDVVESLLAEVAPSVEATGSDPSYPAADPAENRTVGGSDWIGFDELRMRRISKRISRLNAMRAESEEPMTNSFGGVLYGVWRPRGVAAGLNPELAAEVAADVLWSVDSIVWRRVFMGHSLHLLSWSEWAQMLADVMGEPPSSIGVKSSTIKKGRLALAFPGLIERLNDGVRFRDIVTQAEFTWEPQAILERRLAAWNAASTMIRERNQAFRNQAAVMQANLEAALSEAGSFPLNEPRRVQELESWLSNAATALQNSEPTGGWVHPAPTLLRHLILRRGYGSEQAKSMVERVLPTGELVR